MPVQIDAFLSAYGRKYICLPCLGAVTGRDDEDVRSTIQSLLTDGRAESKAGECLNCNGTAFVVRRRVR